MGTRSSLWRKWNFSSFDSVAVNIRTGMLTRPNEIVPDQIERATSAVVPRAPRFRPAADGATPLQTRVRPARKLLHPAGGSMLEAGACRPRVVFNRGKRC